VDLRGHKQARSVAVAIVRFIRYAILRWTDESIFGVSMIIRNPFNNGLELKESPERRFPRQLLHYSCPKARH
jgi:hypothetical protein